MVLINYNYNIAVEINSYAKFFEIDIKELSIQ